MDFCKRGLIKPKLLCSTFFTVIVLLTFVGCNQSSAPDSTVSPPPTTSDLKVKFSVSTASEAFTKVHELINDGTADFASKIVLGDYIDLPSLTIGTTTITDRELNGYGRLLRLTVVGINSFKRNGAAANNSGAPNHVVFQFENIPVERAMNSTNTNVGGYAGSAMKTYIMGDFLTGLKTATGLTDSTDNPADPMLWAPARKVANGGSGATAADTITDTLWLPTEWEMIGAREFSSQTYEVTPGQARLEYYDSWNRIKHNSSNLGTDYWLASPVGSSFFCCVTEFGSDVSDFASNLLGCAPAFCVK